MNTFITRKSHACFRTEMYRRRFYRRIYHSGTQANFRGYAILYTAHVKLQYFRNTLS